MFCKLPSIKSKIPKFDQIHRDSTKLQKKLRKALGMVSEWTDTLKENSEVHDCAHLINYKNFNIPGVEQNIKSIKNIKTNVFFLLFTMASFISAYFEIASRDFIFFGVRLSIWNYESPLSK